jgi:hypothetical protein
VANETMTVRRRAILQRISRDHDRY